MLSDRVAFVLIERGGRQEPTVRHTSTYWPSNFVDMKAVGFFEVGPPEVLRLVELPDPKARPGEILIRVHTAAVNPTDTIPRSGARPEALRGETPPYVPGMDAAGVVEEIGEGVSNELQVGDHVMAIVLPHGSYGAYAERVAVPASSVVRTPSGVSDAEAATLPMNGLTARQALDLLDLTPGETVAVTGAAGIVGRYTIQLAKADGLRVVADAAPRDEELVRSLGADVIVARGPDVADRVRDVVPDGVEGLVDAALLNERAVPMVRDGGSIATLRGFQGDKERDLSYYPVSVRSYANARDKLDRLRQQVEEGAITLFVAAELSGRAGQRGPTPARGRWHERPHRSRVLRPEPESGAVHAPEISLRALAFCRA